MRDEKRRKRRHDRDPKRWLATFLALGIFGCSDPVDEADLPSGGEPGPVEVTVHEVGFRDFSDEVVAVGTLRAEESAEISANVTERVREVHFDDGERVEAGQLLALLAAEEEQGIGDAARASLAEEQREVKRLEPLVGRGVSEAELATRRTRLAVAEARIAQADAQLADRRIVAPFAGRVGLRRISPGALVEPGTVITTLDKTDTMKLDFTVPETFVGNLERGLAIRARSGAFPDRLFEGEVSTVDTRVDPVTRSVTVRALIPNPDDSLKPGMLMTVTLRGEPRRSLAVPERAIVPVGDAKSVYRVVDGTAARTSIVAGARIPGWVEVREGLAEGETVVTDGVLAVRDGFPVEIAGTFEGTTDPFNPKAGQSSR